MIKCKLIFITLILTTLQFLYCLTTFSESNRVIKKRDEILALALDPHSEMVDKIDEIDKLSFKDEELIALYKEILNYYIGEGPGEILSEKITSMGDKMLPFLIEIINMPLKCEEKYKSICYKMEERNRKIRYLIDAIKKGTILYAVYPENLKREAEASMKIIRIILEDFKKQKRSLPKDLSVLREYAWKQYGYKLRIINPWGQPFKYRLKDGNKYILEAGREYQ